MTILSYLRTLWSNRSKLSHKPIEQMSSQELADIRFHLQTIYILTTALGIASFVMLILMGEWIAAVSVIFVAHIRKHQLGSQLALSFVNNEQVHRGEMRQRRKLWGSWIDQDEWNTADEA